MVWFWIEVGQTYWDVQKKAVCAKAFAVVLSESLPPNYNMPLYVFCYFCKLLNKIFCFSLHIKMTEIVAFADNHQLIAFLTETTLSSFSYKPLLIWIWWRVNQVRSQSIPLYCSSVGLLRCKNNPGRFSRISLKPTRFMVSGRVFNRVTRVLSGDQFVRSCRTA